MQSEKTEVVMQMFRNGEFEVGVNYWESVHSIEMWKKWSPDVIDRDFELLSSHGLKLVRCFPMWEDFQPIQFMKSNLGPTVETRFVDGTPLPDTPAGRAGVDEKMMQKFEQFCDIAQKHGIELIVCIMTAQMTFGLFTPPALLEKNLYTDPRALAWEAKYLRYFVSRMKHHKAIRAWESGNESNLLGDPEYPETCRFWMDFVNTVIRSADDSRPVIGVNDNSFSYCDNNHWKMRDIAEVSDTISVHPYPMFDGCETDEFLSIRNMVNPGVKNRIQEDIGGIQSFIEETGVRRSIVSNTAQAAEVVRAMLWNAWSLGCHAFCWWCAFDQGHLTCAPYDWPQPTLELGVFTADRVPMPAAEVMGKFSEFIKKLPFRQLPEKRRDAVCISPDLDMLRTSAILGLMNGEHLYFQAPYQKLREASCYILPSIKARGEFNTSNWESLKQKVRDGATLFISLDDCFLTGLEELCGAVIVKRDEKASDIHCSGKDFEFTFHTKVRRIMESRGAEVLAEDDQNNPLFFRHRFGKGVVYTFAYGIERNAFCTPESFSSNIWKIYREFLGQHSGLVSTSVPQILCSDHFFDENNAASIVYNCTSLQQSVPLKVAENWNIDAFYSDTEKASWQKGNITLPPGAGICFILKKA